ncbi:MAG: hypothetical protein V4510_00620 [bacterium]
MRLILGFCLLAVILSGCTSSSSTTTGIHGHALMGPTCPVERNPPDPNCAPKPYHGTLRLTQGDDPTVTVKTFQTDDAGAFNVSANPGVYRIQSPESQSLPRCYTQETITVVTGRNVEANVDCDTGIR